MSVFGKSTVLDENSEMVLRTLYKKYGAEYYPFFAAIEPAVQSLRDVSNVRAAMQAITKASNSIQIVLGDRSRPATEDETEGLHRNIKEVDKHIQWAVQRRREDIAFDRAAADAEKTVRTSLTSMAAAHKGVLRVTDSMRKRTSQHGPQYQRAMRSIKEQFIYSALGPLGDVAMIAVEGIGGVIRRGRQQRAEARTADALHGLTGSPRMAGYRPFEDVRSAHRQSSHYRRQDTKEDTKEDTNARSRRRYTEEEGPWYKRGFSGFGRAKADTQQGGDTAAAGLSKFFQDDAFKVKWTKDVYKALVTEGGSHIKSFMDNIKDGLVFLSMAAGIATIAVGIVYLVSQWKNMFPDKKQKQTPDERKKGLEAFRTMSLAAIPAIAVMPGIPWQAKLPLMGAAGLVGGGMDLASKHPAFATFLGRAGVVAQRGMQDPRKDPAFASSISGQWIKQYRGMDRKNELTQIGASEADWSKFVKLQAMPGSIDRSATQIPIVVQTQKISLEPLAASINNLTATIEKNQRTQTKQAVVGSNEGDRRGIDDRLVESLAGADMGWDK